MAAASADAASPAAGGGRCGSWPFSSRGRVISSRRDSIRPALLMTDPALLPGAVDEMLRWWTPVMVFRRTATTDAFLADRPGFIQYRKQIG